MRWQSSPQSYVSQFAPLVAHDEMPNSLGMSVLTKTLMRAVDLPPGVRWWRVGTWKLGRIPQSGGAIMDAVVVYESAWGNTMAVAEAVADGLSRHLMVELMEVTAAPPVDSLEVALLVL